MHTRSPYTRLLLSIALAGGGSLSPGARSESALVLEETVVTAQKREESLQDVPVSVSAVSGERIVEQGIINLQEMSTYVPNLTINQTPGASQIFIRGLGSADNQGFEQSVGMFVDGIYAGRARQFEAPFLDVATVEVLRGPQGTLFGKNTIAGAITIATERPTQELEAILRTSYETKYDGYIVDGVVSGPLMDSLSGRVAVRLSDASGYFDNTYLSRDEVDTDNTIWRGSLQWDASENLAFFLKYENGDSDLKGKPSVTDEPGGWGPLIMESDPGFRSSSDKRSTNTPESSKTDSESGTLHADLALGEYQIKSITGYSEYQSDDVIDADTTALDVAALAPSQDFDQWSQELRLTSPLGGPLDFIAGLYYQKNSLHVRRNFGVKPANAVGGPGVNPAFGVLSPFGFQGDFSQDTETYAVFGSVTWHPTDQLNINLGLRYTDERKDAGRKLKYTGYLSGVPLDEVYDPATDPGANFLAKSALQIIGIYEHDIDDDRSVDNWSPTLRTSYDFSDDTMFYFSASGAFKSGGFNEAGLRGDKPGEYPPGGDPDDFEFDDEEATSYELGGKLRLLEGRASLNFAVFYTEFDNLQVSNFRGDSFVVGNAADATSQGVEMDGAILLTEEFSIKGSLAYLDAEYNNFANAPCTIGQQQAIADAGGDPQSCQQDLSGDSLPFAPDWSGVLSLLYQTSLGDYLFSSELDTLYTGDQFLAGDLDPHTKEGSNTRFNARLSLAAPTGLWEVAVVGKNLTDEKVRTFANDPFLLDGLYFAFMAPPRVVELQFNLRY